MCYYQGKTRQACEAQERAIAERAAREEQVREQERQDAERERSRAAEPDEERPAA